VKHTLPLYNLENIETLRLCLGVGFWRGREGKERLGKRSTLVWEF
jgi:hypothetical protein